MNANHVRKGIRTDMDGFTLYTPLCNSLNSTKTQENSRKLTNRRRIGRIFSSLCYIPLVIRRNLGKWGDINPRRLIGRIWMSLDYSPPKVHGQIANKFTKKSTEFQFARRIGRIWLSLRYIPPARP